MNMIFLPPAGSKLRKMWPNGVIGEVVHQNEFNVHLRVKLKGHCEKDPHPVMVVAEWQHVKEE